MSHITTQNTLVSIYTTLLNNKKILLAVPITYACGVGVTVTVHSKLQQFVINGKTGCLYLPYFLPQQTLQVKRRTCNYQVIFADFTSFDLPVIAGTLVREKRVFYGGKHTGYPATLRHNLMIRLVTSYRVKNVISTWIRLATVTKLRDFEV
jgi:hypothetical protein